MQPTSEFTLNQRMNSYSHRSYFFTVVILSLISIGASADVPAKPPSSPIPSININSRQLSCIPPARWDGRTVYLPATFIHQNIGIVVEQLKPPDCYRLSAYDDSLQVTVGQKQYQVGETAFVGPAPQRAAGELLIPLEPLARAFDIDFAVTPVQGGQPIVKLNLPGAEVNNIRLGEHPDRTRVVIDLSQPTGYRWSTGGGGVIIEVPLPASKRTAGGRLRLLTFDNPVVSRIAQSTTADGFIHLVVTATGWHKLDSFALPEPPRIVLSR